jgi:organic hydroperoxide reductase OsmC/OhrA
MLWFLDLAARAGFVVDTYEDAADGRMGRNAAGKLVVDLVTLRPRTRFAGERVPDADELERLHHVAHEECFIANSVRCEIRCEPVLEFTPAPR